MPIVIDIDVSADIDVSTDVKEPITKAINKCYTEQSDAGAMQRTADHDLRTD